MKAVLDACVLFPTLTRGLLLDAADAGVYQPLWSDRILEEWTHAVARDTPSALVAAERVMLTTQWPEATVSVTAQTECALSLPDPDDTHVLAAAIDGQAAAVVTYNMRDFPGRTLARYGVTPWHPDTFLLEALRDAQAPVTDAVRTRLQGLQSTGMTARTALKRARLPRFAKAVEPLL